MPYSGERSFLEVHRLALQGLIDDLIETTALFACLYRTPYGCHFILFMLKRAKKSPLWNPKFRKYGKIGCELVLFSYIVWQCPLRDVFLKPILI